MFGQMYEQIDVHALIVFFVNCPGNISFTQEGMS